MKAFQFPLQRVLEWRELQMRTEEEKLSTLTQRYVISIFSSLLCSSPLSSQSYQTLLSLSITSPSSSL